MTFDLTPTVIRNIVVASFLFAVVMTFTTQVMHGAKDMLFPRPDLDAYCKSIAKTEAP